LQRRILIRLMHVSATGTALRPVFK
jgi:hypothetical protein